METENEKPKKKKRKRWLTIPKDVKPHFMFDTEGDKLNIVAIDPNTYEIVKTFKGVRDMEFATNKKHLQPLLYKYNQGKLGKNGSPLICGWIIVQLDNEEAEEKDAEKVYKMVQRKAIDKIIMFRMQRIRDNLDAFTQGEKENLLEYLTNAESPYPKN